MKKLVLLSMLLVATLVTVVSCKDDGCYTCKYLGVQIDEICRVDFSSDADYEAAKDDIKSTFPLYTCK